jgi:hypothetical protein
MTERGSTMIYMSDLNAGIQISVPHKKGASLHSTPPNFLLVSLSHRVFGENCPDLSLSRPGTNLRAFVTCTLERTPSIAKPIWLLRVVHRNADTSPVPIL